MGNANASLQSAASDVVSSTQSIEDQLCLPCDGEHMHTLREKQEHIIFLRHCYFCTKSNCEQPNCAATKSLLTHMKTCSEGEKCTVEHCGSSQAIISHFRYCKDRHCAFCSPVRKSSKQKRKQRTGRAVTNITTIGRNNILLHGGNRQLPLVYRTRLANRSPDLSAH